LEAGAVSHNHLLFPRDAIEAYLEAGKWEGVERCAADWRNTPTRSRCRSATFTLPVPALWLLLAAKARTRSRSQWSSSVSAKRANGSVCGSRYVKLSRRSKRGAANSSRPGARHHPDAIIASGRDRFSDVREAPY